MPRWVLAACAAGNGRDALLAKEPQLSLSLLPLLAHPTLDVDLQVAPMLMTARATQAEALPFEGNLDALVLHHRITQRLPRHLRQRVHMLLQGLLALQRGKAGHSDANEHRHQAHHQNQLQQREATRACGWAE